MFELVTLSSNISSIIQITTNIILNLFNFFLKQHVHCIRKSLYLRTCLFLKQQGVRQNEYH